MDGTWRGIVVEPPATPPVPGAVVQVVLDVVRTARDGQEFERVIVRGVYPAGVAVPALADGAGRNVVQCFYGQTMDIRALLIPAASEPTGS